MTSWDDGKSGHIRVLMYGKSHKALWRVIGSKVLVSSTMGEGAAFLGALKTAPATVACEKLKEMVAASSGEIARAPTKPVAQAQIPQRRVSRFDIIDAPFA